jgi:hypothetical protein
VANAVLPLLNLARYLLDKHGDSILCTTSVPVREGQCQSMSSAQLVANAALSLLNLATCWTNTAISFSAPRPCLSVKVSARPCLLPNWWPMPRFLC